MRETKAWAGSTSWTARIAGPANTLRFSESGPLSRRMFTESRLQLVWGSSSSRSEVEAPALQVLGAFTSGGAQMTGGQHRFDLEAASDLDYVRGAHSWRVGGLIEGGRYRWTTSRTTSASPSRVSMTFARAAVELHAQDRQSRTLPSRWQAGLYVQDDWHDP